MHNNLFPSDFPDIPDAQVHYDGNFYAFAEAQQLLSKLLNETPWRQNKITVYGKEHDEPRLTQLYGDPGIKYGYSNISYDALPWTTTLQKIKEDVEKATGATFNICLINRYRDGQDSNGWHADNEKELGINPIIASISLGQERFFHLKHHHNKDWKFKFPLQHGSLLVMAGQTQHTYKHQIAKTKRLIDERINLTFRKIVQP
ncbi:alpha-ketoglutarate-dependent dioxygenase AlkB family protein [Nonlabens ulvanivorans]|uniref:2OG-Fe(II) oxygenase n=1 Tax=Nonlabens ulvanivorans TaxID=906888 RepID=A0A084JYF1_NONUL|nr:alpha-ketoglutarate-dependent dioxygenase AlkB [Nonlabens ulvanivorans]KEZ93985.1 2OG-Fe(II) oxygenase [Nonlabens ulvanivorans]PRX14604.1 alkylated DNA repair dioxygenase AlkB [Nonlabens ulvanivorans]